MPTLTDYERQALADVAMLPGPDGYFLLTSMECSVIAGILDRDEDRRPAADVPSLTPSHRRAYDRTVAEQAAR